VSNYTPAPPATDHIRADEPPIPSAGVGRDDGIYEAERLARVAELTLERFAPAPAPGARSTCRRERAVVRHLQRAAQRARAAADRTRLATTSKSTRYVTRVAVGARDVAEAGR
jgi:hypothetical protein